MEIEMTAENRKMLDEYNKARTQLARVNGRLSQLKTELEDLISVLPDGLSYDKETGTINSDQGRFDLRYSNSKEVTETLKEKERVTEIAEAYEKEFKKHGLIPERVLENKQ